MTADDAGLRRPGPRRGWTPDGISGIPAAFQTPDYVGVAVLYLVAIYHEGAPAPKTWSDLTDPRYADALAVPDPSVAASAVGAVGYFAHAPGYGLKFYSDLKSQRRGAGEHTRRRDDGRREGVYKAGITIASSAYLAQQAGSPVGDRLAPTRGSCRLRADRARNPFRGLHTGQGLHLLRRQPGRPGDSRQGRVVSEHARHTRTHDPGRRADRVPRLESHRRRQGHPASGLFAYLRWVSVHRSAGAAPAQWFATALVLALTAFLVVFPILRLVQTALTEDRGSIGTVLTSPGLGRAVANTLLLAVAVTVIAVPVGAGMALAMRRPGVPAVGFWRVAVLVPLLVPQFVLGYSWTQAYGRAGFTDVTVGLPWPGVQGPVGVAVVLVVNAVPVTYLLTAVGLAARAEPDLERAAARPVAAASPRCGPSPCRCCAPHSPRRRCWCSCSPSRTSPCRRCWGRRRLQHGDDQDLPGPLAGL